MAAETLLYWHLLPARPALALALSLSANLASMAVRIVVLLDHGKCAGARLAGERKT